MTFNILFGGGEENRFQNILEIIATARPDVLVLQECLGWEEGKRLRQVAEVMGIPATTPHVHLGIARSRASGNRYHVAVVSRYPLTSIITHNQPVLLGHCIVEADINLGNTVIKLFGTHFDSHKENLRFVEARYLRSIIPPEKFANGLYVLAGDLNSLSLRDPYPKNLEDMLARSGTTKFHFPPRFEVIPDVESFGWVDTLYYRQPERKNWVTAQRNQGGVEIDFRTDYIFASPRLAALVAGVEIINVGNASDHHAVIATFEG